MDQTKKNERDPPQQGNPFEYFKSLAGSLLLPLRKLAKSSVLLAAREFNAPLALDMATAMIAARSNPARPVGICCAKKIGRIDRWLRRDRQRNVPRKNKKKNSNQRKTVN